MHTPRWLHRHPVLAGTGLAFVLLLVVLIGMLSITNWNFARGTVAKAIGAATDRTVRIDGDLSARLLSMRPEVRLERLVIGNPEWAADEDFATVDRLVAALELKELFKGNLAFNRLEIYNPKVLLINEEDGRQNFVFHTPDGDPEAENDGTDAEEAEPPDWPGVRHFTLRGGQLTVRDAKHKLTFTGTVDASEHSAQPEAVPFRLQGKGTLNGEPFVMLLKGGPLANIDMDEPYAFVGYVVAGKTHASVRGTFREPFDVATITTDFSVSGDNLAHLYYLTDLALPFTPPYRLAGAIESGERTVKVNGLYGTVGKSDIRGDVSVQLAKRPKLTADLRSKSLNLADLSPAFGKGVRVDPKTGEALESEAPAKMPPQKLLPTYRFEFDRLRSMNAEVALHADSIQTNKVPLTGVNFKVTLDDGVLKLNPAIFTLPQGTIAANVQIDARQEIAKTTLDLRVKDVKLEQLKGQQAAEGPLGGTLHARLQLKGTGNSVHDIAANATGQINAVIPNGEVRKAFAELTGINVANGLGLLLADDKSRTGVRCGVASIKIEAGDLQVEQLVFDTDSVFITGKGKIDLDSEQMDLEIAGNPKKVRLLRLRTPVTLEGPMRKPNVGVGKEDVAKQAGIAAVLGALVAPITAAIAFIDPGLAKDADCAALLAEAAPKAAPTKVATQQKPATKG